MFFVLFFYTVAAQTERQLTFLCFFRDLPNANSHHNPRVGGSSPSSATIQNRRLTKNKGDRLDSALRQNRRTIRLCSRFDLPLGHRRCAPSPACGENLLGALQRMDGDRGDLRIGAVRLGEPHHRAPAEIPEAEAIETLASPPERLGMGAADKPWHRCGVCSNHSAMERLIGWAMITFSPSPARSTAYPTATCVLPLPAGAETELTYKKRLCFRRLCTVIDSR